MNEAKPIWKSFLGKKMSKKEKQTDAFIADGQYVSFSAKVLHAPFRREDRQGNYDQGNGDRQTPVETPYPVEDDFRKDMADQGTRDAPAMDAAKPNIPNSRRT